MAVNAAADKILPGDAKECCPGFVCVSGSSDSRRHRFDEFAQFVAGHQAGAASLDTDAVRYERNITDRQIDRDTIDPFWTGNHEVAYGIAAKHGLP